jgi:hypothetical protein
MPKWTTIATCVWFVFTCICLCNAFSNKNHQIKSNQKNKPAIVDKNKFRIRLAGKKFDIDEEQKVALEQSAEHAIQYLSRPLVDNENRLAVMLVFAFDLSSPVTETAAERLTYLHCSLSQIHSKIGKFTPIDVYLWLSPGSLSYLPTWIRQQFPTVIVMSIPIASWKVPSNVGHPLTWRFFGEVFSEDYFLMGRWRMMFAMHFVRRLNYQFMLQIDDDSFQLQQISFNIVDHFKRHKLHMGIRGRMFVEVDKVLSGLMPLTRYWMETRNLTTPTAFPGTIFQHTTPANIDGITLNGWDKLIHSGCFVVLGTAFWFDETVQDFLNTILSTGSDIEMRWTEQAVQNLARLLFLSEKSVFRFPGTGLLHGKPGMTNMNFVGCPNSTQASGFSTPDQNNTKIFCRFPILIDEDRMRSEEIIHFDWRCEQFNSILGDCSIANNRAQSVTWYINSFCLSFYSDLLSVCQLRLHKSIEENCNAISKEINDTIINVLAKKSEDSSSRKTKTKKKRRKKKKRVPLFEL